jgi:predicted nucleic acid-binding protein
MPGVDRSPRHAVLDASIAVRWVIPEVGSEEAAELLERSFRWIAPRLMIVEVASALRRKVAEGELSSEVAYQALDALMAELAHGGIKLATDEDVVTLALVLAISLRHRLPDCVYLALAEREGADLVTADRRLSELAANRGVRTIFVQSV